MAKKKKDTAFIRELGSDILALQQLLEKHKPGISTSTFTRIKSSLDRKKLDYDSGVLELSLIGDEIPRHLSHDKIDKLRICFSTKLEINYNNLVDSNDPFNKLEFNIWAYANDLKKEKELVYSLHLDRHIFEEGDEIPDEVHPMYHFQFGGKKLKHNSKGMKIERDYGEILFFDSPRISYHPMDFILGLDFLLSNFFPKIWQDLYQEPRYINILKKYQEYFMKPYYQSIANSFNRTLPQNWNAKEIYPQLIGR